MQENQPALPLRDHTVLGVCEALGEDFGFNPLWLRILFASFIIWKPVEVVVAYLAIGVLVMISRLLVPSRRRAAVATEIDAPVEAANANAEPLPVAA